MVSVTAFKTREFGFSSPRIQPQEVQIDRFLRNHLEHQGRQRGVWIGLHLDFPVRVIRSSRLGNDREAHPAANGRKSHTASSIG